MQVDWLQEIEKNYPFKSVCFVKFIGCPKAFEFW